MPVIEVQGDLTESDCHVIAHGCNCFNTMGSGIARAIREKFPQAFTVDQATKRGDRSKLGNMTWIYHQEKNKFVLNLYTQYEFGTHQRQLDYEALFLCLDRLKNFVQDLDDATATTNKVGLPRIGCGLAGGDWDAVKAIINYIFPDKDIYVYYL